jgi:hypothetical protein
MQMAWGQRPQTSPAGQIESTDRMNRTRDASKIQEPLGGRGNETNWSQIPTSPCQAREISPVCSACGSSRVQFELTGEGRCLDCGWRLRIGPDGAVRDALDFARAGRGGRRR